MASYSRVAYASASLSRRLLQRFGNCEAFRATQTCRARALPRAGKSSGAHNCLKANDRRLRRNASLLVRGDAKFALAVTNNLRIFMRALGSKASLSIEHPWRVLTASFRATSYDSPSASRVQRTSFRTLSRHSKQPSAPKDNQHRGSR